MLLEYSVPGLHLVSPISLVRLEHNLERFERGTVPESHESDVLLRPYGPHPAINAANVALIER
jgi:hypothetical protein